VCSLQIVKLKSEALLNHSATTFKEPKDTMAIEPMMEMTFPNR